MIIILLMQVSISGTVWNISVKMFGNIKIYNILFIYGIGLILIVLP